MVTRQNAARRTYPGRAVGEGRPPGRQLRRPGRLTGMTRSAHGWGLSTVHESGQVLDTWFPAPSLGPASADDDPPQALVAASRRDDERRVHQSPSLWSRPRHAAIRCTGRVPATAPAECPALPPRTIDHRRLLDPAECRLVIRTGRGGRLETTCLALFGAGPGDGVRSGQVPRMTDYVVPAGSESPTRPGQAGRPLASGTTVMHEGSSLQRRHLALHGGGSDFGWLWSVTVLTSAAEPPSWGRYPVAVRQITIGERCLLGAESGVGISSAMTAWSRPAPYHRRNEGVASGGRW